jgi:hypothetical protein
MMFGSPVIPTLNLPRFGGGPNADGSMSLAAQTNPPTTGGMFGGGKRQAALMALAAGFMSRRNPQMAGAMMNFLQQRQQAQLEEAQQQRLQDAMLQREKALIDYKGPEQGETERLINTWNSLPDSDPRKAMIASAIQHPVAMDVTGPDGSVTRQYVYPGSIPQQQQPRVFNSLPPDAVPIGGQTPQASGGFPRSY